MSQTEAQLLACHRSVYTRFATFGYALLVVCALLSGVRVSAQATSGVTGVVTDSSGGIVIGAKVTLTDPGTGFAATAQTNGLGVYQFSG